MGAALPDYLLAGLDESLAAGLKAFGVPAPVTLPVWSAEHFYLSAESSYVEQAWRPWVFQVGILACLGHDDIVEVDCKKSARVGWSKMVLADICYKLHHKRRNIAIWQPTDDDRDQWVKTEFETALRDVKVMADILPGYLAKSKENTLKQKMLLGCTAHTLGGKAAKNFRRISVDAAYLEEISGFDQNIEKEGDAFTLAKKRLEGASFPKIAAGSTPKLRGLCQIEARVGAAQIILRFEIPCPECGEYHPVTWGGRKASHGMKWTVGATDAETAASVRQLCPHCGAL